MNIRVFVAILGGCILGGAFVYTFAGKAIWYMMGVPLGGITAWLIYAWRDIKREVPHVWNSVSSWRPDTGRWHARGIYILSTILLATVTTLNVVILALLTAGPAAIYQEGFYLFIMFAFAIIFALSIHDSLDTYRERREHSASIYRILSVAKKKRELIFALSPIGVSIMLFELAVYLPTLARIVGKFLVKLFIRVHTNEALNSFIYATLGVLTGSLLTQSIWVMVIGAASGILLALFMSTASSLIKRQWPALAE